MESISGDGEPDVRIVKGGSDDHLARSDASVRIEDLLIRLAAIPSRTCTVCLQQIAPLHASRRLGCMHHEAHAWCLGSCTECTPPPKHRYTRFIERVLFGIMGDAYADDPRRSVMMASTLGFLWAVQPFVFVIGSDAESFTFFVFFTWMYAPFISMPLSACIALWLNGSYGLNWTNPVGHVLDIALCWAMTLAFGYSDISNALFVFVFIFWRTWNRPRMWDFHPGNCCGMYTLAIYVGFVSVISAMITSSMSHETFQSQSSAFHAYIICNACFDPQTADPFSAYAAGKIRKAFWCLFILFLILGKD